VRSSVEAGTSRRPRRRHVSRGLRWPCAPKTCSTWRRRRGAREATSRAYRPSHRDAACSC